MALRNYYLACGVMGWCWRNVETGRTNMELGATHETIGAAKRAALSYGYRIVEGEQGVFAQKKEG